MNNRFNYFRALLCLLFVPNLSSAQSSATLQSPPMLELLARGGKNRFPCDLSRSIPTVKEAVAQPGEKAVQLLCRSSEGVQSAATVFSMLPPAEHLMHVKASNFLAQGDKLIDSYPKAGRLLIARDGKAVVIDVSGKELQLPSAGAYFRLTGEGKIALARDTGSDILTTAYRVVDVESGRIAAIDQVPGHIRVPFAAAVRGSRTLIVGYDYPANGPFLGVFTMSEPHPRYVEISSPYCSQVMPTSVAFSANGTPLVGGSCLRKEPQKERGAALQKIGFVADERGEVVFPSEGSRNPALVAVLEDGTLVGVFQEGETAEVKFLEVPTPVAGS